MSISPLHETSDAVKETDGKASYCSQLYNNAATSELMKAGVYNTSLPPVASMLETLKTVLIVLNPYRAFCTAREIIN